MISLLTTESGNLLISEDGRLLVIEYTLAEIKGRLVVLAREDNFIALPCITEFTALPRKVEFTVLPRDTKFRLR